MHADFAKLTKIPKFGLFVALMACSGSPNPHAPTGLGLPKWDGHAREVWDDNIDAAALGVQMEGSSPRSDKFLRERAQTSDLVARLRVQTVTVDTLGDENRYHLGMQVGFPTLATPKMEEKIFEIDVRSTTRAYEVVKAFETRLRGQTFIGFVSRFSNADGDLEYHWHLAADNADVAAAVKEALALQEIKSK